MKAINSQDQVRDFAAYINDFERELQRAANETDDMLETLDDDAAANDLGRLREAIGEAHCLILDLQWNHLRVMLKTVREVPALKQAA